ncbi:hypothetical protein CATMIT_00181, partial [Catenibacterium mitsuokai DSM 15897]
YLIPSLIQNFSIKCNIDKKPQPYFMLGWGCCVVSIDKKAQIPFQDCSFEQSFLVL